MDNLGTLYVAATPIGNLGDVSVRLKEVLSGADAIFAEDTRQAGKLLQAVGIVKKPLSTLHEHSGILAFEAVETFLKEGKNVVYISDAGTPGISDPGGKLVEYIASALADAPIVPISGPSAVATALSVCGFSADKFLFLGFPPQKNKRNAFFAEVANSAHTVVFYESCHRIHKCLEELSAALSLDRKIVVCRELTKKFETIYRGTALEIANKNISDKGEFAVVVEGKK